MGNLKLKGKDILKLGYPNNKSITIALEVAQKNLGDKNILYVKAMLKKILKEPEAFKGDLTYGQIAETLIECGKVHRQVLREQRVPFQIFGTEISEEAKYQLYTSLKLPISVKGALMPDGHSGYGLPIGGVLATRNAVIPNAVGLDIGCRMCLSILDTPVQALTGSISKYEHALELHTKFGLSETHKSQVDAEILDHDAFFQIPLLRSLRDKAAKQLGSSGGGNHFVEFGEVDVLTSKNEFGLPIGKYVGILSHSGSRGLGANIAQYYTRMANKYCPLPKEAQHLAWLDLDTHLGLEYWTSMELAGEYASACHHDIHRRLIKAVGGRVLSRIENHHNYAWKEQVDGEELIVHRKGATPAALDQLGFIPGTMSDKGFIVKGLGNADAINSASHGAGRAFSRGDAKRSFTMNAVNNMLKINNVKLIGGKVEEAPMAYKNINEVMNAQQDLVEILGTFQPRIVRMDR